MQISTPKVAKIKSWSAPNYSKYIFVLSKYSLPLSEIHPSLMWQGIKFIIGINIALISNPQQPSPPINYKGEIANLENIFSSVT